MSGWQGAGKKIPPPPAQQNLGVAARIGFDAVQCQPAEQLRWLGAQAIERGWRVPVLGGAVDVDLSARRVTTPDGAMAKAAWTILALHYLGIASRPEPGVPNVTFADLPTARSYAPVYEARVLARLCRTAGRDLQRLTAAARALGGHADPGSAGDAAFDFRVFPRVPVRLVWHAPDEEFPPSATLLLPGNIESFFCSEDIVVLSELLVSRLEGGGF